MGFSRQEYWSGLPCPPPGDLPNPGIKTRSPTLQGNSFLSEPPQKPTNTGVGSLSLLQGNSQPRNETRVSCIAGRYFASWATREALEPHKFPPRSLQNGCGVHRACLQWNCGEGGTCSRQGGGPVLIRRCGSGSNYQACCFLCDVSLKEWHPHLGRDQSGAGDGGAWGGVGTWQGLGWSYRPWCSDMSPMLYFRGHMSSSQDDWQPYSMIHMVAGDLSWQPVDGPPPRLAAARSPGAPRCSECHRVTSETPHSRSYFGSPRISSWFKKKNGMCRVTPPP